MKDLDNALKDLQQAFFAHRNPGIAAGMKKYMKGHFDFVGLKKPLRSELETPFVQICKNCNFQELRYTVLKLWQLPEREFQYTALVLMRKAKIWKHRDALKLLNDLLVDKSWWDSVDGLAAWLAGPYFLTFPETRDPALRQWLKSDNLWLHRTCLIFQITYRDKTDIPLLYSIIRRFTGEKEFFIKKAIGWALRSLSYTYPEEVMRLCESETMQPLSYREALKVIRRKGLVNSG